MFLLDPATQIIEKNLLEFSRINKACATAVESYWNDQDRVPPHIIMKMRYILSAQLKYFSPRSLEQIFLQYAMQDTSLPIRALFKNAADHWQDPAIQEYKQNKFVSFEKQSKEKQIAFARNTLQHLLANTDESSLLYTTLLISDSKSKSYHAKSLIKLSLEANIVNIMAIVAAIYLRPILEEQEKKEGGNKYAAFLFLLLVFAASTSFCIFANPERTKGIRYHFSRFINFKMEKENNAAKDIRDFLEEKKLALTH